MAGAFMCAALPCFAIDSTLSYVNINDLAYQDVEIVITDNSQIWVPFKQLADIFEIPLQNVSFKSKSHEHVGEIGRGEAAMCHALATVKITA